MMSVNIGKDPTRWRVGLVGYGEVGRILAEDLGSRGVARRSAYDPKFRTGEAQPLRAHAAAHGVALAESHIELTAKCELVISAVTASQTVAAARACAAAIRPGAWFLDLNSASPSAKQRAAALIEGGGGRYVESAVMTSVPPHRIGVPMLFGGPHAAQLQSLLAPLGFSARVFPGELGLASASKMCRSVMIKGLEAMVIESLTAARAYGVEDAVLRSLAESFPGIDWERQANYFLQRVIEHGRRRAEEMREAVRAVQETGLSAWSASGTAERQAWMAELADAGVFGVRGTADFARSSDWRIEADRILAHLSETDKGSAA